jgi:radical SAM enzyme (TIGR01210 family)
MELSEAEQAILSRATRSEIVRARGAKSLLSPREPAGYFLQREPACRGEVVEVATLFLTGAECPFACSMCDLWKHTFDTETKAGDLIAQVEIGLANLPPAPWIKLYNASNFFDPRAVPDSDRIEIGRRVASMDRVIVENHPRLLDRERVRTFRDLLHGKLEIAIGLETVHPFAMQVMNKQMHPCDYEDAMRWLREEEIDGRAFVLLQPPGVRSEEAIASLIDTVQFAANAGVRHISLIPTRRGNPWLDRLIDDGLYRLPALDALETAFQRCLELFPQQIVVADTWDWSSIPGQCDRCSKARLRRIDQVNLDQYWRELDEAIACRCTKAMS